MKELDIQTTIRGDVSPAAREYAERKVERLVRLAPRPILFARLELRHEPDPAVERPAIAKASLDLSGRRVRAHVAAATMDEAADQLEARLRRSFEMIAERQEGRFHETGIPTPGHWRHGDVRAQRPGYFPRPVEDRDILRRATYVVVSMTPEEAVAEMELLHHDFLLFRSSWSDLDNLVYRKPDGGYGLITAGEGRGTAEPYVDWITVDATSAPTLTLLEAEERLDVSGEPFVFFVDPDRDRGAIIYRRYDGHYGLIEARDDAVDTTAGRRTGTSTTG